MANRDGISPEPFEVLAVIQSIAEEHNLSTGNTASYLVTGRSAISKIHIASRHGAKALLHACKQGLPRMFRSRCGADLVHVKLNLIAFYFHPRKVIKVFGDSHSQVRHLLGAKTFVASCPSTFRVPEIVHSSHGPVPYVIETLEPGDPVRKPNTFSKAQILDLSKFHFQNVEFAQWSFSGSDQEIIRGGLSRMSLSKRVKELVDQVLTADDGGLSAWGHAHGDLCTGNMLESGGSRILVDWENFRRGPVAANICKIWMQSDDVTRRRIIQEYDAAQHRAAHELPPPHVKPSPFGIQLFKGLLNRVIILHTRKYAELLNRKGSVELAAKAFEKVELELQEVLNRYPDLLATLASSGPAASVERVLQAAPLHGRR
jgi:hypothetical protein